VPVARKCLTGAALVTTGLQWRAPVVARGKEWGEGLATQGSWDDLFNCCQLHGTIIIVVQYKVHLLR
jgi:hypothetical protein